MRETKQDAGKMAGKRDAPRKRTARQAPKEAATRSRSDRACMRCGTPVAVTWRLPSSCKECGASFDARPRWIVTVAFFVATILAVATMALLSSIISTTGILVVLGLAIGLVCFVLTEVLMFRLNILRLTNINAPDDSPSVSLNPTDPQALAEAEKAARAKGYAGSNKSTRVAQGAQLRQSIQLAKSLTGSEDAASPSIDDDTRKVARKSTGSTSHPRCSFARVSSSNSEVLRRTSTLATDIAREHFDPLVGAEQNDYMIDHFLSPHAMREQIERGYEYYVVLAPEDKHPIGIVALRPPRDHALHICRFYLLKEERGKGYAHSMMQLVRQRARKTGCSLVTVDVMRNNYQAILAYEHLGFKRVGERLDYIGSDYVVDNLIYELKLPH